MSLLNPPPRLLFFFSVRVPLLLPLAKQTIKSMHDSGRDSTRCKHFRQPTTVFLPRPGCSLPPLIGRDGCTDVPSLMIFVTIKLIVVYGSEMQECGGKWSRLMDREVGDFGEGRGECDNGINMRRGAFRLLGQRWWRLWVDVTSGMETGASHVPRHTKTHSHTYTQPHECMNILCGPSKSFM